VKVLLTGGTGYVGRYVADACVSTGWDVHLLTRPSSVVPASLLGRVTRHDHDASFDSLYAVLQHCAPDCVVHLASAPTAISSPGQAKQIIDVNVALPTLLLEAMLQTGVHRFVNTGTFWQHYESETFRPVDLYAASKQAFQDVLLHYTGNRALAALTLKLFDNYGPDDPRRKIVTLLIDAAGRGDELALSGGDQVLDLTHVKDVARAYVQAISLVMAVPQGTNASYFVSGERMSLKELSAIISKVSGSGALPRFGMRPYREREIMVPIDPGKDRLPGWAAVRSVEEAVSDLLIPRETNVEALPPLAPRILR
jgi:nucleoside-diphosphate-sugar epimerase